VLFGKGEVCRPWRAGIKFLDPGPGGELSYRPFAHDDGERDNGRARPAGKLVHVEVGPVGEEHRFDRHGGDAVPGKLAEQGKKNLGKDAALGNPPLFQNKGARLGHGRVVGRITGQLEREIGLYSSGNIAGTAIVNGPEPLFGLLAQEVIGHLPFPILFHHPQEMEQHNVLGGNGDVGFQLGPPISGG
jgi:hypothetical protein